MTLLQYAYFKQMTHAAMVIQHGYRSYCAHKRFKKAASQEGRGAVDSGGSGGGGGCLSSGSISVSSATTIATTLTTGSVSVTQGGKGKGSPSSLK